MLPTRALLRHLSSPARGIPASFWRGGTSNGLMIAGSALPAWSQLTPAQKSDIKHCEHVLQPFFAAAMGSPDPYGRQLNGMGGGVSSLSKAVIVEAATRDDAGGRGDEGTDVDVNYWFVQIGIKDGKLDMGGNCGNLTSAVAPFAIDTGILSEEDITKVLVGEKAGDARMSYFRLNDQIPSTTVTQQDQQREFETQTLSIILRNMNTNKKIKADIHTATSNSSIRFEERGTYKLAGVSGSSSPITLSFLDPAGAKTGKAFPTGNTVDTLEVDGKQIRATLSDISNPGVFVDGREVGWTDPKREPNDLTASTALMEYLEKIRREGTRMMGLDPDVPSIPKIVLVYPPDEADEGVDVRCQALSMQQAHKAVPGTLGLNLGVVSKIEGTIPYQLARQRDKENTVVGHPSGKMEVGAEIDEGGRIVGAKLIRTARWLMDGTVNDTPSEEWEEI